MSNPKPYDAIIIGSGQAGDPLVFTLADAGWKMALVEREHVGGTCINKGCTPTKTMVASGRVAYLAKRGADYGVQTGPINVDLSVVRQRKRKIVEEFRGGTEKGLKEHPNIDFYFGEGSFTNPTTVQVKMNGSGTEMLTAPQIFINTGARTAIPPIPGLQEVPFLTSTSIMELGEVPEHLLVLGGGYIGLEFGQMFHRFGAKVTVVQRAPQLLGREDEDVAAEVANILRQDGINVLLNTDAVGVGRGAKGEVQLTVKDANGEQVLTGSHLLVAVGRMPNTDRLNLAAAGVETLKGGFVKTNERLETNVPGIYALGDVKGGPSFTHISYDDFRIVKANLLNGGNSTFRDRPVPYTVFMDPQLGRIGLSEAEAKATGRKVRIAKLSMASVARALEMDEARGFMKAIVDAETDQILGAVVLGIEGGEIATMFQLAMMGKLPYTALRDAIFPHPGFAEALNNLFDFGFQN